MLVIMLTYIAFGLCMLAICKNADLWEWSYYSPHAPIVLLVTGTRTEGSLIGICVLIKFCYLRRDGLRALEHCSLPWLILAPHLSLLPHWIPDLSLLFYSRLWSKYLLYSREENGQFMVDSLYPGWESPELSPHGGTWHRSWVIHHLTPGMWRSPAQPSSIYPRWADVPDDLPCICGTWERWTWMRREELSWVPKSSSHLRKIAAFPDLATVHASAAEGTFYAILL